MLEFIAGLGMGMVLGAGLGLAVMIYLKNQGYGLQHSDTPATEGRVDSILTDVAGLKGDVTRIDARLDAVAETVVRLDLDRGKERVGPRIPEEPTGIVEAE